MRGFQLMHNKVKIIFGKLALSYIAASMAINAECSKSTIENTMEAAK